MGIIDCTPTYTGMVSLDSDAFIDEWEFYTSAEITPDEAEELAAVLLGVAKQARRRVRCHQPLIDPAATVYGVTAKSTLCMCGEDIFLNHGATEWIHTRDLANGDG